MQLAKGILVQLAADGTLRCYHVEEFNAASMAHVDALPSDAVILQLSAPPVEVVEPSVPTLSLHVWQLVSKRHKSLHPHPFILQPPCRGCKAIGRAAACVHVSDNLAAAVLAMSVCLYTSRADLSSWTSS